MEDMEVEGMEAIPTDHPEATTKLGTITTPISLSTMAMARTKEATDKATTTMQQIVVPA
jgi:hypothetical protein